MLEILALVHLTRRIGTMVSAKGRKPFRYKLLTVALWVGGEIFGFIAGALVVQFAGLPEASAYLFALAGAVLGAVTAYFIAKTVPPTEIAPPPDPPTFH
jgi:membrane protein DedA with SNARE-associated domain